MNAVKKSVLTAWLAGSLIYAFTTGPRHFIQHSTTWELREQLVFLTGVWAMAMMVLTMIIPVRSGWLSRKFGGLDKAYMAHKWAGIFSVLFALMHWLLENVPRWLVALDVIPNPGELTDGSQFTDLEIALFQSGMLMAEVFFYLFLLLVLIALLTGIPYKYFRITHKIFPGVFLLLAWHAGTAQLKERWLASPGGYMLLALLLVGSVAAIISLFQLIGNSRKVKAVIQRIQQGRNVLDVTLKVSGKGFAHCPGQYAFVQFAHSHESHPFSMVSSGNDTSTVRFAIKGLGDFTKALHQHIREGQEVIVEGPYGEFTFEDGSDRQIWIAAGIGITPFLSRLEHLKECGGVKQRIDFWFCTRGDLFNQFPACVQGRCLENGIDFFHINSDLREYLTIEALKARYDHFRNTSVWFCGPHKMSVQLRRALILNGLEADNFHYDSFNIR